MLILETLEETLAYLQKPEPPSCDPVKWATCSIPLMDFMDELEKTGYVYNTLAMRAFEKAHNLPQFADNSSPLSLLVYTCQSYRRARRLEVEGWEVLTPEILAQAMAEKKRVIVKGESALGGAVEEAFVVRIWKGNGQPCAFRPKKQKPLKVGGMPCKLVA